MRRQPRLLPAFLSIAMGLAITSAGWLVSAPPAHADGNEVEKIRVEITDNGFNNDPDFTIEVAQGAVVEITFVWAQTMDLDDEHVIVLKGYGVETDKITYFNKESTLKFIADKPGSFELTCDVDCEIHDVLRRGHLKVGAGGSAGSGGGSASALTKTALSLTPSAWSVTSGPVILTASLKDAEGAGVPKAEVRFFVEADFAGTKGLREVGIADTDSTGMAQVVFQPTTEGTQRVLARFEGVGLYAESEQSVEVEAVGDLPTYSIAPASLEALRARAPFVVAAAVLAVWTAYGFAVYQAIRIVRSGSARAAETGRKG